MSLPVYDQALLFLGFAIVSTLIVQGLRRWPRVRDVLLTIASIAVVSFYVEHGSAKMFAAYAGLVIACYVLPVGTRSNKLLAAFAKHLPVVVLIAIKLQASAITFPVLGISYLCLRLWKLNIEYDAGAFEKPAFTSYLAFAFYFPTWIIGPINSIKSFQEVEEISKSITLSALLRILYGAGKFFVLGTVVSRLNFENLWHDGRLHGFFDFTISCMSYFLFLYLNFSGFIDMMLGLARLNGIVLPENFDHPLSARNAKEFWNRWHITLSLLIRDTIFTPLSKFFVGLFGSRYLNACIAVSIFISFIIAGVWHGNGLNFAMYGAWQGIGLALNHMYTVFLRKHLGKGIRSYEKNPLIKMAAIVVTFFFFTYGFFFFENSWTEMKWIVHNLSRFYGY